MFWDRQLDNAITRLKRDVHAPVRVVLWDGREVAFSDEPRVTVRLNDMNAAAALRRPSLDALARGLHRGGCGHRRRRARGDPGRGSDLACGGHPRGPRAVPEPPLARATTARRSSHHYDVSNEFYALWLDPRMVYSCAYFRTEGDSLETAQLQKLDHICRKLRLAPGERFLDIGCGWGALAIHAAREYGVDATGITLSENQHRLATERIREAGLQDRCRVLLQDYRDLPGEGTFDKVASVGMFEHVGAGQPPGVFRHRAACPAGAGPLPESRHHVFRRRQPRGRVGRGRVHRPLRVPEGRAAAPASRHPRHERAGLRGARRRVAPRPTMRRRSGSGAPRSSGTSRRPRRASSERTARIWRLYLAGCAHAFEQGWISIYQVLATRRAEPGPTRLPLTREWMYPR